MLMTGNVSHILETGSAEPVDSRAAFGARVAEARSRLGISRAELARRVGTAASHISMLERGRAGASLENTSGIARELKVSVDYLFGFTEDPTPAADLQHELREKKAEIHDLRAGTAPAEPSEETWTEYVGIVEVDTAAGVGAVVGNEQVTGLAKFSHAWLRSQGLIASRCRIMRVTGESMEPTLPDGCGILVNLEATEAEGREDLRHPCRRRAPGQARRQQPGSRLVAGLRPPGQAGMAEPALARRGDRGRRGAMVATIVRVERTVGAAGQATARVLANVDEGRLRVALCEREAGRGAHGSALKETCRIVFRHAARER